MSKADVLLKKATSFEKLALYSDRKTFLQAIAQTYPDPNASVDPSAFSDREVEQWDSQKTPQGIPPAPKDPGYPMSPPPRMNAPAVREQGKPAPQQQRKIDPQYQKLLGVTPDGVWGPETQQALNAYKVKINSPGLSDGVALGRLLGEQYTK